MKKLIATLLVLSLAGCANLKFQWSASYKTDDLVEDLKAARCAK